MSEMMIFSANGDHLKITSVNRPLLHAKKGHCQLLEIDPGTFEWVVSEQIGNAKKQSVRFKVSNRLEIQCHTRDAVDGCGRIQFQIIIKDNGEVTQLLGILDLEDCTKLVDHVKSIKMQVAMLPPPRESELLDMKENCDPKYSKIVRTSSKISENKSGSSCSSRSCNVDQFSGTSSNSKSGPMNTAHCYSIEVAEKLFHSNISKLTIRGKEFANLKRFLMEYADLKKPGDKAKLSILQQLFQRISFKENACDRGKIQALVAGSYPSFIAGKVKNYEDVDIFLLWNPNTRHLEEHQKWILLMLKFLNSSTKEGGACYYNASMDGIKSVVNVGRLQFIVKIYNHDCYCSFHVDSIFFEAFHHVTRWKFLVFTVKGAEGKHDLVICRYIPYKEQRGVVAKRIAIVVGLDDAKYPSKHKENRKDFYPPSLYQQALRATMKCEKESLGLMKLINAE